MTKVSVVIPTHNRPERLANAIRSVLAQTEKDFEVLVIDDGSPDEGAAHVVRACRDARVSYIRLPVSQGPGAARNAGVTRASAPYVAFLDDDDEWLPEKLQVQLAVLERSEPSVGGVYTARITVDEVSGRTVITRFRGEKFDPTRSGNLIDTSSVLMRRGCFDVVGLFDEELLASQDYDLWMRVGEVFELRYVDQPLIKYFKHHSYRITNDYARKARAQELFLAKHRRFFDANRHRHCLEYVSLGLRYRRLGDRTKAWKALRRAMWLWPFEPRVYWAFMKPLRAQPR